MGINDGLVSNFCLVMGLAGGTNNDHQIVLIAAFIGLLAGSLSMAAGEYVSVRAQRDIYENTYSILWNVLKETTMANEPNL